MEAQVRKLRHSLIGKSLIPVILWVKGFEDELQGAHGQVEKGSLSYTVLHGGVGNTICGIDGRLWATF